ncbi:hypothetical protein ILUMI_14331 [Ignelater luminosus]|uniref:PiggyBac transposable element-derived protein domain-containing protein n=1 Tax=Ignelater luminosus TaxID=2038154 RepID=A0A8K0CV01_IGNLU|nr:hypothetical protein ILUMI_14331 [Ignelater luminosus]
MPPRVINDVTKSTANKFHKIYFGNFFNTVQLQRNLLDMVTYSCGTVKKCRAKIPKDFGENKQLKRRDYDFRVTKNRTVCLRWMDKKAAHFRSNFHDPTSVITVSRKKKAGTVETRQVSTAWDTLIKST